MDTIELNEANAAVEADEMTLLKQRAKQLGITFSNNISLEKLRERINEKLVGTVEEDGEENVAVQPKTRQQIVAEQMRLVRVRLTNLDPKKANVPGEVFTVANEYVGAVRKFIPYGEVSEDGYHVPYIIFKALKRRKFLNIVTRKDQRTGTNFVEHRMVPEFAIEVLPQLTPDELKALAAAQTAAGGV